jgi:glycosyltransferase involved in cell wall biosynthesis
MKRRNMTIFQLISSEGFYGAESMLVALSGSLVRSGETLIVGVFQNSRNPHMEVADFALRQGLTVKIIPCGGRWSRKAVREIGDLLDEYQVDILHSHGYKADLYGYAASWARRVALVSTCHNWPNRSVKMRVYAALDRFILKGFDRVATPSPIVVKTLVESGLPPTRLKWIANGVDMSRFHGASPSLRIDMNCGRVPLVGFVGRLVPGKGGANLLRAAQGVLAVCPDARFVLVGDGPCRSEWEAMAANLGIGGKVTFTGTRADMPGVYASFDLLVLPSFDEALPMCLLEAMSAAKPVIATNVGGVPRLVIPGRTGLLVEPGDTAGIAAAILRLLKDPPFARQLGAGGFDHVAAQFSSDIVAKTYLALYEEALASCRELKTTQHAWQVGRS